MRLGVWAKQIGVSYRTAWRMGKAGTLPVPAERFGFEYVEAVLAAEGGKILVMEKEETAEDIAGDLHEVMVSMCARLYDKRSAANRAKKAMEVLHG